MAKILEIFKCDLCGSIVEGVHEGGGELVCCGKPMAKQEEQTADYKNEKHVPVIEKTAEGIKVVVGSTPHPMADDHYIEWIEVINGDFVNRKFLKPGDKPEAEFHVKYSDSLIAREYCNKHSLWKTS
ncbi:MAG: desulfoferrodoxin [bacterium]|nr:desulfoferrodoxin [bacterium]